MKSMNNKLAVIVISAACVLCLGLAACGGSPSSSSAPSTSASSSAAASSSSAPAESKDASINDYAGTWNATKATSNDEEMPIDGGITFVLNNDGSLEFNWMGRPGTGTWTETETGFIVKNEGNLEIVVEEPGKGVLDYESVKIYFEKAK